MATAEVMHAKGWTTALIRMESRGPGDTDNAMRRLARRYGLEYGALWSLRYRSPKRIWADVHTALANAYAAECERQMRALQHDIELTTRVAGSHHPAVVAAATVVGASDRQTEGR